jgi:hypothetical protein
MTNTTQAAIIFRKEVTVAGVVMVLEEDANGGMFLNGDKVESAKNEEESHTVNTLKGGH